MAKKQTATLVGIRADGKLLVRLDDGTHTVAKAASDDAASYVPRLGETIEVKDLKSGWKEATR